MNLQISANVFPRVVLFVVCCSFLVPTAPPQSSSAEQVVTSLNITEAGGWTSVWTRRGTSRVWDGIWTSGTSRVTTVMEGDVQGNQVTLKRTSSTDGNLCAYRGTIAPDGQSATGVQVCAGYPDVKWVAKVVRSGSVTNSSAQSGGTINIIEAEGWTSVWTRRGTSRTWDGIWTNGSARVTTVMEGDIQGNQLSFKRTSSTDGNLCSYRGTIASDGVSISGTQTCAGYPDVSSKGKLAGTQVSSNAVRYRVENLVYNNPDIYTNPRNLHDFMVDFSNCTIRSLSQQADEGLVRVQVLVCRANRRLTFTASFEGNIVEYDWAFRDGGKIVAGAWRQGAGFGPCVGGILGSDSGWDVR